MRARVRGPRAARVGAALSIACFAALWGGCQAPQPTDAPAERVLNVPDYPAFCREAMSTLRRYDFPPDRVDLARGIIVTAPATSAQWFEPWRIDAQGGYQAMEASLHTIQRRVTVEITPVDAPPTASAPADPDAPRPGSYRVSVRVDKERFTAPERQITTASGAMGMYSARVPTMEGLRGPASGGRWVPLGRDPLLESALLARIAETLPDATHAK